MKRDREMQTEEENEEVRFNPNHDEKGRFSSGNGLTKGTGNVKIDSKGEPYEFPELRLPNKEYGKVIHEINTLYHTRFEGHSQSVITISRTNYKFEIHGFDEYNIFMKWRD